MLCTHNQSSEESAPYPKAVRTNPNLKLPELQTQDLSNSVKKKQVRHLTNTPSWIIASNENPYKYSTAIRQTATRQSPSSRSMNEHPEKAKKQSPSVHAEWVDNNKTKAYPC